MGKVIASYPSVKRAKASMNIPTNVSNAILQPKSAGTHCYHERCVFYADWYQRQYVGATRFRLVGARS